MEEVSEEGFALKCRGNATGYKSVGEKHGCFYATQPKERNASKARKIKLIGPSPVARVVGVKTVVGVLSTK